ncbi:IS3 family transposase ISPfr13 [bioreactor metagenome]|uniref:IS3 family transposase ISPfr13 n=1 Tax=bioreactor metagenome TaxID=1076179 RepID=A0A644Y8F0_9ZZZZ
MPERIDPDLRTRAVRLVREHRRGYSTMAAACLAVAKELGVGKETVRRWVVQAEVDAGQREEGTTAEAEEIGRLRGENRRLREDVAILKAAASFLRGTRPPQTTDDRL